MIPGLTASACAFAALLAVAPAQAEECTPAEEGPTVAQQPEAWRAAVAELRAATSDAHQPWGCAGGTIDLVVHEGGATLLVRTADGTTVSREVESIEDLVPLGEALLAKPVIAVPEAPAPAIAPPTPMVSTTKSDGVAPLPPTGDPHVVVGAIAAPRYAGRSNVLLGGVTAAVGVPIASWVPGGWLRFDGPLASLDEHANSFLEVCIGASFGRVFSAGPVDITPALNGSAAIQIRPEERHGAGETHVDARIGAETRIAFPRRSLFRAVLVADTELAPGEFRDDPPQGVSDGAPPTQFPSYTVGLGVGFEIAPR